MDILGQRIGDMQLIRLIGKGAVARVYLASDGQKVLAVKVFPPGGLKHAQREFDLGAGLDHPHLNEVLELHELQGQPALLLPYLQGTQLSKWLAADRGPADFFSVLPDIIGALEHLAGLGIVHRDLKPENLIVGADSHVTLFDYDIATRAGTVEPLARMAGTLAFLSPEQARGQAVTPASDLYSLGVLIYWGICREVPFSGDPASVVASHLNRTPGLVSDLKPEHKQFDGLVAGLLAKDSADRPGHRQVKEAILGLA